MWLTSPAFTDGGKLPKDYTADGKKSSPPLSWGEVPEGTKCFALLMVDPDIPEQYKGNFPEGFLHWALMDVPVETMSLAEGAASAGGQLPSGAKMLQNHFAAMNMPELAWCYGPPWPPDAGPEGKGHGYKFTVYALSTPHLPLSDEADFAAILKGAKDAALAEATIVGYYGPSETPLPGS
jgi:Raf kinase inhibitor-like YbhB/YbcL family protein